MWLTTLTRMLIIFIANDNLRDVTKASKNGFVVTRDYTFLHKNYFSLRLGGLEFLQKNECLIAFNLFLIFENSTTF